MALLANSLAFALLNIEQSRCSIHRILFHVKECEENLRPKQSDGHVIGAPHDAFWKSGAGGFALIIVPSLDPVIYKMVENND